MTHLKGFRRDRSRTEGRELKDQWGGEEMETTVCEGREDSMWETRRRGLEELWAHLPFWGRDSSPAEIAGQR